LIVPAAEAQLNLLLDGTADAFEGFLVPRQVGPIVERPSLRLLVQPSLSVGYLLFNRKAYGDRSKPHPILADPVVRRALTLGIDRQRLIRSIFGPYASVVDGPMGQASWVRRIAPKGPGFDPGLARRLLAERGWVDTDGDGVRDQNGVALSLRLNYPGTSIPRVSTTEPIQEMLRAIGVRIELIRLEGRVWAERRGKGEFDIDFSQANLDPTPSGLVQSWSCAGIGGGSGNVGSICDPEFDAALTAAIRAGDDATSQWRRTIGLLQGNYPAVFLYSPAQSVILHTRFRGVVIRADLPWSDLWRWSVDPAERLARDQR
jgi:peptide/nickel transport system substrate-binding protein